MFSRGELYDAIEESHDYEADAARLHALIQERVPGARTLLDVACGTGRHLPHLAVHYEVEGVDVDSDYLERARRRVPDVPLHHHDMVDLNLGREFDAVICMGSAIGYVRTKARLWQAIATLARHAAAGGLLVVEPFVSPDRWPNERRGGIQLRRGAQVAWASVTGREGELATIDMAFLAIGSERIEHTEERHLLGLFSHEDHMSAFEAAGLEQVEHDEQGLNRTPPRGLYLARM